MAAADGALALVGGVGGDGAGPGGPPALGGPVGVLLGRPDLAQDSLQNLRDQQRSLRSEAKRVKRDLKNAQRKKQRIMRRVSSLGNEDIVQVLLERGMQLTGAEMLPAAKAKGKAKAKAKAKAAAAPADGAAEGEVPEPDGAEHSDAGAGDEEPVNEEAAPEESNEE